MPVRFQEALQVEQNDWAVKKCGALRNRVI